MHAKTSRKSLATTLWNSLEVAKMSASIVTPVAIAFLGYAFWSTQRGVVENWEKQQLIERQILDSRERERDRLREFRLAILKDAAPLLNDIYAYHFYIGSWKELTPANIIEKKRHLDRLMYSNEVLFTSDFFNAYRDFMKQSFATARNYIGESKIRTDSKCRSAHWGNSSGNWLPLFTNEDNRDKVCVAYRKLQGRLSEELLFQNINIANGDGGQCPKKYERGNCG